MATMAATIQNEMAAGKAMQAMTETPSPTAIASFQLSGAKVFPLSGATVLKTGGCDSTAVEVIATFLPEGERNETREMSFARLSSGVSGYLIRPASFSRFSWNLATLSNVVLPSCLPVMARSYWSCCWVRSSKNCGTCHMSFCQSRPGAQALFHGRNVIYLGSV